MHVYAGGVINVSSIDVNAADVYIDVAGLVTASCRGYPSDSGPGVGVASLSGSASGAGHGGSGGVGNGQTIAGKSYGSFLEPNDFGSGGGYGHKRLVSYIFYTHSLSWIFFVVLLDIV